MSRYYQNSFVETLNILSSNPETGLAEADAVERLQKYGANELVERGMKSRWRILAEQFTETMVVVLIIAAFISLFLGEFTDATAILVIVVLNGLLGYSQEYKAEQAMAALKKLAVPTVRVRRDGHVKEISAILLVPGDIVLLESGNLVPADCQLIESVNLSTQEAALTGESVPVAKKAAFKPTLAEDGELDKIPLAERLNMVYMGTVVTYGRGSAVVTETGMDTELGGIAELMQSAGQEQTPLQKRLGQLGKGLAFAALILVGIVFGLGLLRGEELEVLFLTSISIAVAAIPEGLPAVVTIALAMGARRMLKRQALIRKLPAVETLGSVTVICSDKTGTLTENRMTVTVLDMAEHRIDMSEEIIRLPLRERGSLSLGDEPDLDQRKAMIDAPALTIMLAGGALCNDALLEADDDNRKNFRIVGDPTEGALLIAAARMGLSKHILEGIFPRRVEVPFDSERKRMTTVHDWPEARAELPEQVRAIWDWDGWIGAGQMEYISVTKGAVDSLLDVSDRVWVKDHVEPLDENWCSRIENANENLANKGMRVLGIAIRSMDKLPELDSDVIDDSGAPDVHKNIENKLI